MADDCTSGSTSGRLEQNLPQQQREQRSGDAHTISSPVPSEDTHNIDDEVVEDLQSLRPRAKTGWDQSWDEDGVAGGRWVKHMYVNSAPINFLVSRCHTVSCNQLSDTEAVPVLPMPDSQPP